MRVSNMLGLVEAQRGNDDAALAWFGKSLELAQKLGELRSEAAARGNRAILEALARPGAALPSTEIPASFADLLDQAWEAAASPPIR